MRREGGICPRHFREGQVNERKWKEEEGGGRKREEKRRGIGTRLRGRKRRRR
jgi:hypothetical protein